MEFPGSLHSLLRDRPSERPPGMTCRTLAAALAPAAWPLQMRVPAVRLHLTDTFTCSGTAVSLGGAFVLVARKNCNWHRKAELGGSWERPDTGELAVKRSTYRQKQQGRHSKFAKFRWRKGFLGAAVEFTGGSFISWRGGGQMVRLHRCASRSSCPWQGCRCLHVRHQPLCCRQRNRCR